MGGGIKYLSENSKFNYRIGKLVEERMEETNKNIDNEKRADFVW